MVSSAEASSAMKRRPLSSPTFSSSILASSVVIASSSRFQEEGARSVLAMPDRRGVEVSALPRDVLFRAVRAGHAGADRVGEVAAEGRVDVLELRDAASDPAGHRLADPLDGVGSEGSAPSAQPGG